MAPRTRRDGPTSAESLRTAVLTEKALLAHVRKAARFYGFRCYHTRYSLGSDKGFPDCILVGHGRVIAAELKGPRGVLTSEQAGWLVELHAAGVETFMWRPSDLDRIHETLRGPAAAREQGGE